MVVRGTTATKASKARALPKFWVTVNSYLNQGGRLCPPCLAQIRCGAPEFTEVVQNYADQFLTKYYTTYIPTYQPLLVNLVNNDP